MSLNKCSLMVIVMFDPHARGLYYLQKVLPRYNFPKSVCVSQLMDMLETAFMAYMELDFDMMRLVFLNYQLVTHELLMAMGRPDVARPLVIPKHKLWWQRKLWRDMVKMCPCLSGTPGSVVVIQAYARRWLAKRDVAARKIQRACYNWLWHARTRDGGVGINPRLMLRDIASLHEQVGN